MRAAKSLRLLHRGKITNDFGVLVSANSLCKFVLVLLAVFSLCKFVLVLLVVCTFVRSPGTCMDLAYRSGTGYCFPPCKFLGPTLSKEDKKYLPKVSELQVKLKYSFVTLKCFFEYHTSQLQHELVATQSQGQLHHPTKSCVRSLANYTRSPQVMYSHSPTSTRRTPTPNRIVSGPCTVPEGLQVTSGVGRDVLGKACDIPGEQCRVFGSERSNADVCDCNCVVRNNARNYV